jgi:serine/threonine protein kinase
MAFTKQPNAEPIPGYRLIAPLGSGGFGEVWKCEAPGGLFKAIKFVYGNLNQVGGDTNQAHEELKAIQCIKDLRHPFLLSIDRVESCDGELMIVTELADKNLHELLLDYRRQGQPGVPRQELLRYLGEAAEVLDLMNSQHGLQHLDVKPRNFFLVSKHVKVADFGLVTSMAGTGSGLKLGAVTPLYASPEVFQGRVSPSSDQYSLACSFMELLTGKLPFEGRNSRQMLMQHLKAEPNLTPLPEGDRPTIARALAKDPAKRFKTCTDFIRALRGKAPRSADEVDLGELPAKAKGVAAAVEEDTTLHCHVKPGTGRPALEETPNGRKQTEPAPRGLKAPPTVPAALRDHVFVQNQGSSLLADVWKVTTPQGKARQVKFLFGFAGRAEDAVRRLRALQHPALQPLEVVQSDPGCLVLVSDYPKDTVRDRFLKCQAQKLSGIPRLELLGYLRTVAEAIDYLYQQHSLQHLGLNPRSLLLEDDGLQIAEFGLAHLFWVPAGQAIAQRNVRYAAPELFERKVHPSADQYSLALMFQELLTGSHPFSGQARANATSSRGRVKPDLSALSSADEAVIARALDADPAQRWPSCTDLMRALEGAVSDMQPPSHFDSDAFTDIISGADQPVLPAGTGAAPEDLRQIIGELIAQAGGDPLAVEAGDAPSLCNGGTELRHKFRAGLPVGAARGKLDTYRRQCNGELLHDEEGRCAFSVAAPANFWQLWTGRQPALEVEVQLARQHALSATPIDVAVSIRAVRCGHKKAAQLVQDMGANLLEGLRAFLLVNSEKRMHDRLLWPHPVEVCAVERDGTVAAPLTCRGKDISMSGMGFYLPRELPTSQVLIQLPATPGGSALTVPATLVRAKRCADGWYDVGALFRLATLRKSMPDLCTAGGR